jgi:ribonucleotide reductase alpha subunit
MFQCSGTNINVEIKGNLMTKKVETPWGELGYITFKRTYARRLKETDPNSPTEEFEDTVNRVVKGAVKQLKVPFSNREEKRFKEIMLQLKGTVAGRFFWQLGTKTVDKLGLASLQNCFGGEVEFVTKQGIRSFNSFKDGDEVEIRGANSWKKATVKSFGKQYLRELVLTRGKRVETIRTTDNHRWITKDGNIKTTEELEIGDRLKVFTKRTNFHNLKMCPIGVQHGLVFGDGNVNSNAKCCAITLCGDSVEEMKNLFPQHDVSKKEITGLPWNWKEFPDLEKVNKHYLYGFLSGWFAADGSLGINGSNVTLASSKKENLQYLRGALMRLDLSSSQIKVSRELSPFDGTEKPLYRITIDRDNLPKEFFILNKHKERFQKVKIQLDWKVSDIHYCGDEDKVWCVVEPDKEEFTLANGILTKNCAFTVVDEPIKPFTWAFDMLMLGSGVGYNIQREFVYKLPKVGRKKIKITRLESADADYIVPDTREGWVKLLGKVLKAYFYDTEGFSYSTHCVRGKGTLIKGFGGLASGPEDLVEGINSICNILQDRRGKQLRPIDCLDIMNIIGQIVVSGNVRRSAQIAIGDYDDMDFLSAKDWSNGNIPNWRAMSNNSVVCNDISKLPNKFWEGYMGNGEPYGLINLKLAQSCGRIGETQYPDPDVLGFNPCAEQSLAPYETCCLAEIHLPNITSLKELQEVATYLYRVNKHSLAVKCHQKDTEDIVHRNMRMGIGITGEQMATKEQRSWLKPTYEYLRKYDKKYSKKHGFPVSVKITTVKPSGTLSLLSGVTAGAHPGYSHYFIRRIRMASNIPLVDVCRKNGYHIEYVKGFDGKEDRSTVVVSFPCKFPEHTVVAKDVSAIDQLETIKRLQNDWSDNSVSVTIYYKKEELAGIKKWLAENYNDNLKTVSFLLHSEHGFQQAPYEEINKKQYEKMVKDVNPITNVEIDENSIDESQIGCEGGVCPIK